MLNIIRIGPSLDKVEYISSKTAQADESTNLMASMAHAANPVLYPRPHPQCTPCGLLSRAF